MKKYTWSHDCKAMPHYGKPIRLVHVDIDRCVYCGEISPRKQAETDAAAAKLLQDTKPLKPKGGKP
jgi:hypothetical protein